MKIKLSDKIKKMNVNDPKILVEILTTTLNKEQKLDRDKEHCWGIYFNSRNNIKRIELISLGDVNANIVNPREVLRGAIETSSLAFIIAHNHPSGDPEPSEDDIALTRRLEEASKIMGIEFYDHLIITEEGKFFSLKEKGLF